MQRVRGGRNLRSGYSNFFMELTNGVRCSILQLRARSEAAVLSSGPQKSRKIKRVPLSDRRADIESYVARYRSANTGKFPTITGVQKEVGGSFYIVRKVVQELQYSLKVRSPNIEHGSFSAGGVVENEVALDISEIKDALQTVRVEDTQMSGISNKQEQEAGRLLAEGIVEDEKLMTEDEVALTISETKEELHTFMVEDIQMTYITDRHLENVGGSQVNGNVEDEKLLNEEVLSTVSGTTEEVKAVIVEDFQMIEISDKQVEDDGGLQAEVVVEDKKLMTEDGEPSTVSETKEELHTAVFKDIQIDEISGKQVEAAGGTQADSMSENMLLDGVPESKTSSFHEDLDDTSGNLQTTCSPQEEKKEIEPNTDAQHTRTSSFWSNLKSFADGILNIWRK